MQWAKVTPWVMDSPEELRPPKPPALKSEQYKQSYMMGASCVSRAYTCLALC